MHPPDSVPPSPAGWRGFIKTFWPLLALFFALRLAGGLRVPVWNDEPLFVDYMQQMHDDFGKNIWISLSGETDWKPPLQFWTGSLFMGFSKNPLVAARFATVLVATAGFAFGLKLARDATGSAPFAALAGVLWAVNPYTLVVDQTALSDSWVMAFGCVYFYFIHAMCAAYLDGREKSALAAWLAAAATGALMLMVKQTGEPFLVYALAFAPAMLLRRGGARYRDAAALLSFSLAAAIAARMLFEEIIPVRAMAWKPYAPMTRDLLFSAEEVLALPVNTWLSNTAVAFIRTPLDCFGAWFCFAGTAAFFGSFAVARARRRLLLLAAALVAAVNVAPVLVMKSPAVRSLGANSLFAWFLLFAASFYFLWERVKFLRPGSTFARHFPLLALAAALPFQAADLRFFTVSPWDWQKTVGDVYGVKGCLKTQDCGWSSPVNVERSVDYLADEDRRGNGGLLFVDPQWGHPGMYAWIMRYRFPHIKVQGVITPALLNDMPNALAAARRQTGAKYIYILFNGPRPRPLLEERDGANWLKEFYDKGFCPDRTVMDQGSTQSNIFICRFPTKAEGPPTPG